MIYHPDRTRLFPEHKAVNDNDGYEAGWQQWLAEQACDPEEPLYNAPVSTCLWFWGFWNRLTRPLKRKAASRRYWND